MSALPQVRQDWQLTATRQEEGLAKDRLFVIVAVILATFMEVLDSTVNLNVTFWDVFLPLFLQGLALGLVFVPLTVLAVAASPMKEWGMPPACST